jgi:hypothetical protein
MRDESSSLRRSNSNRSGASERSPSGRTVIVQGADFLEPEALPDDLRRLYERQAIKLDSSQWHDDVARLIEWLDQQLTP